MFTSFKRKKIQEEPNFQEDVKPEKKSHPANNNNNTSNQNKSESQDISTIKLTEDKIYELDLNNVIYTILIGYSKDNNSLLIKASPPDSDEVLVYSYYEAIFSYEKLLKLSRSFRMYDSIEEIFSAICFIFENKKSFLKQNSISEIDNGNNDIKELLSLVIIVGSATGKENEIFLDLSKKEIIKEKKVVEKNDEECEGGKTGSENPNMNFEEFCVRLKKLEKEFKFENEELKSKVYYLEDDNIRYKKSLDECKKEIRYLKNQIKDLKNLIEVKFKNVNDSINKLSTKNNSVNSSANKSLNINNNEIIEDEINENFDLENNSKNIIDEDTVQYRRKKYSKEELNTVYFKSKNSSNIKDNNIKNPKPEIKRPNTRKEVGLDLNSSINKKLAAIKEEKEKFLTKSTFNEDTKSKKNIRKEPPQTIIEEKANKSNKNLPKKNIEKNIYNKNNYNNNYNNTPDKEKESPKRERKKTNYRIYDNNINSKIGAPIPNDNQTNIFASCELQHGFSNIEEKYKKSDKKTSEENRVDKIDKWKCDFNLNIKKVIEDNESKLKLAEKMNRINRRIINNINELLLIENQLNENYPDSKNIEYELLYRASEDGDSAEIFHEKCDNTPFTLSIIKTSEGNKFGGYTENTWEGENISKLDGNAFCFSLTKNTIYNVKPDHVAINCNPDGGISFGAPLFEVFDNCFTNGGMCYPLKNCCFAGQNYDFEICNGEEKFDIVEIEVYQLYFS